MALGLPKPLVDNYVFGPQLALLRRLHEVAGVESPSLLMENNFRPSMPVNRRTVRTNIKPNSQVRCHYDFIPIVTFN